MSDSRRSDAAERLLAGARRGAEPTPADQRRVRTSLHGRILGAPLLLEARSAHALAATGKTSVFKALLICGLCGGSAVVAGVVVTRAPSGHVDWGTNAPRAATQPASLPKPAAPTPIAPIAPTPQTTPSSRMRATATMPSSPQTAQDLQVEISGLRHAQQLLHSGNAAGALGALDELAREAPSGVLMEEREATRVLALCSLGGVQRPTVERFLAKYPNSVHASRVRNACGRVIPQ